MALPDSRDFTAIDGGPLPHTVINNLQDQIVDGTHGEIIVQVGIGGATYTQGAATAIEASILTGESRIIAAADEIVHFDANFPIGTVLRSLTVYFNHNSAAAPRVTLRTMNWFTDVGTEIVAWGSDTGDGSAGEDQLTISGADQVIVAGTSYRAVFEMKNLNHLYGIEWTIAKLT